MLRSQRENEASTIEVCEVYSGANLIVRKNQKLKNMRIINIKIDDT